MLEFLITLEYNTKIDLGAFILLKTRGLGNIEEYHNEETYTMYADENILFMIFQMFLTFITYDIP